MQVKLKSAVFAKSAQPKQQARSRFLLLINLFFLAIIILGSVIIVKSNNSSASVSKNRTSKFGNLLNSIASPLPTPIPLPTPTPSPRPLTFSEMNALYGPCVHLPVLMYHHIQSKESAAALKQTSLTVYTDIFQTQMSYLKTRNYNILTINDLINFFDSETPIPPKSILLTFDDGYQDFYTDAYPILNSFGFKSVMFLPTGLMQNPGYLSWDQILQMTGSVYFANHTWSHANVAASNTNMQKEISLADTELTDKNLNPQKVFAYPYGSISIPAKNYLQSLNYKLAFTTIPGNVECKKQRLYLPRIRIGNAPLSNYGF